MISDRIREGLHNHWKAYKKIWISIFILFIVSRVILFGISFIVFSKLPILPYQHWKAGLIVEHPILNTFAVWDSEWYIQIAERGYSGSKPFDPEKYSSVGFFPLYPFLVFLANLFIGDSLISGLIISNILFLVSAFLLYLLVKEKEDEATATRSMWYLFLFPSAYIFSAVYPESLLLALWLGSVLSAQKGKWALAGVFGFLAAMTKPVGFFIFIPIILIYLYKKNVTWNFLKNSSWKNIRPNILWLFLVPLGLLSVSFIHYLSVGDMFAYSHVQQGAWNHSLVNPLFSIYEHMTRLSFDWAFNAWIILLFLIVLIFGYKKLPFAYWIFTLCVALFIPTNHLIIGVWRYIASFFPFIILLALWGKSENVNRALTVSMPLLQGCLFVFWILGYWFVS